MTNCFYLKTIELDSQRDLNLLTISYAHHVNSTPIPCDYACSVCFSRRSGQCALERVLDGGYGTGCSLAEYVHLGHLDLRQRIASQITCSIAGLRVDLDGNSNRDNDVPDHSVTIRSVETERIETFLNDLADYLQSRLQNPRSFFDGYRERNTGEQELDSEFMELLYELEKSELGTDQSFLKLVSWADKFDSFQKPCLQTVHLHCNSGLSYGHVRR